MGKAHRGLGIGVGSDVAPKCDTRMMEEDKIVRLVHQNVQRVPKVVQEERNRGINRRVSSEEVVAYKIHLEGHRIDPANPFVFFLGREARVKICISQ